MTPNSLGEPWQADLVDRAYPNPLCRCNKSMGYTSNAEVRILKGSTGEL